MPQSPLIVVDDKHVPLYRIVWISEKPHFCGEPDCTREGEYEIRLDVDDSLWASAASRDQVIAALSSWCSDPRTEDGPDWE